MVFGLLCSWQQKEQGSRGITEIIMRSFQNVWRELEFVRGAPIPWRGTGGHVQTLGPGYSLRLWPVTSTNIFWLGNYIRRIFVLEKRIKNDQKSFQRMLPKVKCSHNSTAGGSLGRKLCDRVRIPRNEWSCPSTRTLFLIREQHVACDAETSKKKCIV